MDRRPEDEGGFNPEMGFLGNLNMPAPHSNQSLTPDLFSAYIQAQAGISAVLQVPQPTQGVPGQDNLPAEAPQNVYVSPPSQDAPLPGAAPATATQDETGQ
jgi:hypothetical protein